MTNRNDDGKTPRPNPKAATQLTALINARIPKGHGFALLTFPLGEAVDPRMLYIGTGDREDVLTVMQHWIDEQTKGGLGLTSAVKATQWTTVRPKVPGLYLLKTDDVMTREPEFLRLTDADGQLQINHWDGQQFDATHDFVNELDPALHIWLGPIPEPWHGAKPAIVQPVESIDEEAGKLAVHHVEHFEEMSKAYFLEVQGRTNEPGEPLPDMIKSLVGNALAHGYAQGIAQQLNNPR